MQVSGKDSDKDHNPDELKIEVLRKRPTHSGGRLLRLSSKKDVEILEKAVKREEGLSETV